MPAADRGVYEKDLIKVDERVNILNMVFSGMVFKTIPVPGDPNNAWASRHISGHDPQEASSPVAEKFFAAYVPALQEAKVGGNYALPDKLVGELVAYQNEKGGDLVPSQEKISGDT